MEQQAAAFKALGEPTRLKLAALLAGFGEACVCQLAEAIGEPDFKVSRHLSVLRSAGLVVSRREGTWIYYRLAAAESSFLASLHDCLRVVVAGQPVVQQGIDRLKHTGCGPPTGKGMPTDCGNASSKAAPAQP